MALKLFKPDTESTEKWKSEHYDFEVHLRTNFTMRELNTAMSFADEPAYDQNKYMLSVLIVDIITELVDDEGKSVELVRDKFKSQGVQLIADEFIDMLPPSLFVELADFCMTKAVTRLSGESAKN